jgi:hypothetical protein
MALYFSRRLLEPLHGTPMYEGIQSALEKIGAVVSLRMPSLRGSLDSGISVSNFGRKDYRKAGDVFTKLMHGMRNHFTLELEYKAPRREQAGRYRRDPYKLWYQDHRTLCRRVGSLPGGFPRLRCRADRRRKYD